MITNKQNHNVFDYDYIESNHDYICLEISSNRKPNPFAWFDVSIFSDNKGLNQCNLNKITNL